MLSLNFNVKRIKGQTIYIYVYFKMSKLVKILINCIIKGAKKPLLYNSILFLIYFI